MTISDLVSVLYRRRWIALGFAVVATVVAALALFRTTPLYEATASLSVDRGRKAVSFQTDPDQGRIEFSLLNTHRELILSSTVLEQALRSCDLISGPAFSTAREPVQVLRKRLDVKTSRDSWVITISLRDEDPNRATRGVQAVLDSYLGMQAKRQQDKSKGALTFLSKQVSEARERVEQARAREQQFRNEKSILSNDADRNHLSEKLTTLNSQRLDIEKQLAAAEALAAQVALANESPNPRLALLSIDPIAKDPTVVEQQKDLYALMRKRVELQQKYLDDHPRLREVDEQMKTQESRLTQAVQTARGALETNRQQLKEQARTISERIAKQEEELGFYRANLISLKALAEETQSRQALFEVLLNRLGQEEVSSRLDEQQVLVVDSPRASSDPANIKKPLFAAGSLLAGLVAATIGALLAEAMDRRVRGPIGAQTVTGLPLLGEIPFQQGLVALGKGGDPTQPHAVAEAFRALRATLRLTRRTGDDVSTVLMITSSSPGEGKSTVSTRLALALASTGASVVIIDADMRKPTLHHQIGDRHERGLSYLLAGETDVTPQPTSWPNLDFIGCGVRPPNPAELIHGDTLPQLIADLRKRYRYVLIDTPPVGLVSDGLLVAEHVDQIVLVIRDRHTNKGMVRNVISRMAPVHHKLAGVVLNGEILDRDGYYYYDYKYKYGYNYKYGHKQDHPADEPVASPS